MARTPHPWYRAERDEWCVTLRGQHHVLGRHPEGARRPQKSGTPARWNAPASIREAFHKLMSAPPEDPTPAPPVKQRPQDDRSLVVGVVKHFTDWCRDNREPLTARRYRELLQGFVNAEHGGGPLGLLPVAELTPGHVTAWLDGKKTWGPTTRKNAITAVQAAMNHGVANLGLPRNPVKGMKKPEARRRKDVITAHEFAQLLEMLDGDPFADLLTVSYDCGARPFEVKGLERRHVEQAKKRAVIPADEAKGRTHARTIYFPTARSWAIMERLCKERPEGPLFRNAKGNGWTGAAVKCRFEDVQLAFGVREMERLGVKLDTSEESIAEVMKGIPMTRKSREGKVTEKKRWEVRKEARQKLIASQAMKHAKRFNHYAFRRTFITRKIIAGVDSHVVAKLSGHQSTAMIDRHYSAVADDHEFMLRQAERDIK